MQSQKQVMGAQELAGDLRGLCRTCRTRGARDGKSMDKALADTANRADDSRWTIMNNLTISNNDHADGTWVSLCFLSFRKDVQQFLLVILNAAFSLEVSTRSSSSSAAKGRVEIGSDKMKQLLKETMRWVWAESCFRCYVHTIYYGSCELLSRS
jgi:hypothetical protein